tara:strand:+ start:1094 stop:1444 length:351 start_codon:yes stop_codon:yes gene_type:complete
MRKRLFILITLITVIQFSYASFPVIESDVEILNTIVSDDNEEDEPSLFEAILMAILVVSILGFASYFLIRTWWRAWRDEVRWVRIFTYVILGILSLILLLGVICGTVKGGCVYNMQ